MRLFYRQHKGLVDQHRENIEHREVQIKSEQKKLVRSMRQDINKLDELNRILGNGITLQFYIGLGKNHVR